MIPDFPMPPGLHGIFDSNSDGETDGEICSSTPKCQTRIYHTFEEFTIPDDEFDDRGFNDPLPYSPIIKQVQQFFDLEFWISPERPQPSSSPDAPSCPPPGPLTQISTFFNFYEEEKENSFA